MNQCKISYDDLVVYFDRRAAIEGAEPESSPEKAPLPRVRFETPAPAAPPASPVSPLSPAPTASSPAEKEPPRADGAAPAPAAGNSPTRADGDPPKLEQQPGGKPAEGAERTGGTDGGGSGVLGRGVGPGRPALLAILPVAVVVLLWVLRPSGGLRSRAAAAASPQRMSPPTVTGEAPPSGSAQPQRGGMDQGAGAAAAGPHKGKDSSPGPRGGGGGGGGGDATAGAEAVIEARIAAAEARLAELRWMLAAAAAGGGGMRDPNRGEPDDEKGGHGRPGGSGYRGDGRREARR